MGPQIVIVVMVGLHHLGELLQLLETVLSVALTFSLLTDLQPFLDNVGDFLINFTVSSPLHFCFRHAQDILFLALSDVWHMAELLVVVVIPVLYVLPLYKLFSQVTGWSMRRSKAFVKYVIGLGIEVCSEGTSVWSGALGTCSCLTCPAWHGGGTWGPPISDTQASPPPGSPHLVWHGAAAPSVQC